MGEKIGKILTCDRCGREVFLRFTKTERLDGGFTNIDHFEKAPEGWKLRESYEKNYFMLCPDCNGELDQIHKNYMGVEENGN